MNDNLTKQICSFELITTCWYLTPAVILDSKKFKGHRLTSSSLTGGGGGFQRTKYGIRAYAPPTQERTRKGQTGILVFELHDQMETIKFGSDGKENRDCLKQLSV